MADDALDLFLGRSAKRPTRTAVTGVTVSTETVTTETLTPSSKVSVETPKATDDVSAVTVEPSPPPAATRRPVAAPPTPPRPSGRPPKPVGDRYTDLHRRAAFHLSNDLIDVIDAESRRRGMSKSAFIALAVTNEADRRR